MMSEIDYNVLDPGIRDVVRMLRAAGFNTTDSGDGVTKIAAGWTRYTEALPYPHVWCRVPDGAGLIVEAERLLRCLPEWRIEATYCPNDGSRLLFARLEKL